MDKIANQLNLNDIYRTFCQETKFLKLLREIENLTKYTVCCVHRSEESVLRYQISTNSSTGWT